VKLLIDSYKKSGQLHHAYILEGDQEFTRKELFTFIEHDLQEQVKGNPDLWHFQYETLTIDDARALRDAQSNKAISTGRKIFIIETRFMTIEAQNALLKVFEEPTPNTHFFIITPNAEVFLPTLRSRIVRVAVENTEHKKNTQAKDFLSLPYKARLERVADIVEQKDKGGAIELVDGIIAELYARTKTKDMRLSNSEIMQELLTSRGYLNDRSPSLKLLLEHISLIVQ
jgi:DNA polymerase III delta prime subunit